MCVRQWESVSAASVSQSLKAAGEIWVNTSALLPPYVCRLSPTDSQWNRYKSRLNAQPLGTHQPSIYLLLHQIITAQFYST